MKHTCFAAMLFISLCSRNIAVVGLQRTVSTTGQDTSDCSGSPCQSISYAVSKAISGDTISIQAGEYRGSQNREVLVAEKNLFIVGAGSSNTIIDLELQGRAIIFSNSSSSIMGLSVVNGLGSVTPYQGATSIGGGIIVAFASLNMTNIVLDNCSSPGFSYSSPGGCLYTRSAKMNMYNVQFLNCSAGIAAGWYSIGKTVAYGDNLQFINCISETGWGGAWVPEEDTSAFITNSLFENNYSSFGGAINNGGNASHTITNSLFKYNTAIYGGAVYTFGSTVSVFDNCTFLNNSATNAGGVARTTSSSVSSWQNCRFESNYAKGSGGAISVFSTLSTNVINSTFVRNMAQQEGGALVHGGPTVIINSLFEDNLSNYISAALDLGLLDLALNNCTFRRNLAFQGAAIAVNAPLSVYLVFNDLVFDSNIGTSGGGAIILFGKANVTLVNSVFYNNSGPQGGAILTTENSVLTAINATFTSNKGTNGGTIYASDASSVFIFGSSFMSNSAILYGGSIYQDSQSVIRLIDVDFTNNSARSGGAYSLSAFGSNCFDFANVTFANNVASLGGGALFFSTIPSSCNFDDLCPTCSFTSNVALFGNDTASVAYELSLKNRFASIASTETFSIVILALDRFGQLVRQSNSILIEAAVSSGNSTLQGILQQEVPDSGISSFKLLKLLAFPSTQTTITFSSLTETIKPAELLLNITNCNGGASSYMLNGQYHCLEIFNVKEPLQISIYIVASACILLAVALLLSLIWYRNHTVIRKASPTLCYLIVIGAILCYISTYMWLFTEDGFCVLRVWLLVIGFSVMYTSFIAKEWRLYRLFSRDNLSVTGISDATLIKIVAIWTGFEMLVVLFWFIFFPYLQRITIDVESVQESIKFECFSSQVPFLYTILAINALLLLFGCLVAIATRNIPSNYNESKHLAFSIYNATLTMFVVVPVASVLPDPNSISIAVTSGIIFSTTASLAVLFGPKLHLTLRKGAMVKSLKSDIDKLNSDLVWKKRQLGELESRVTNVQSSTTQPVESPNPLAGTH